jgi:predicted acetyltransferase
MMDKPSGQVEIEHEGRKTVANVQDVFVVPALADDAALLANLLELYQYDLSEVFPVELGANGRFGYERLPLYWSEPTRRFPFLIRHGDRVVGFALITRGSPASDDPDVFDVAEFFVVRRHRRFGVARDAAFQVWDRFPGRWIVRVSEGNVAAWPFWTRVIAEYARDTVTETTRAGTPHAWRVFAFDGPGSRFQRLGIRVDEAHL